MFVIVCIFCVLPLLFHFLAGFSFIAKLK